MQNQPESLNEYLGEYNDVLSSIWLDGEVNDSLLASPTANKQETVTQLYQTLKSSGDKQTFLDIFVSYLPILFFLPRLLLVFVRLVWIRITVTHDELPPSAVFLRTWLVNRSFDKGQIKDDYFRMVPEELGERLDVVVVFSLLDFGPIKKLKGRNSNFKWVLGPSLLNLREIVLLFWDYLNHAKPKPVSSKRFKQKDISCFINRSLSLDFWLLRSFPAFLEKHIVKKLGNSKPRALIYVYENQALEKMLCRYCDRHITKLIGYQSSGFSFKFLNFFPSDLDADISPMPDYILTVGDHFTDVLKRYGHYKVPIETFGALRFAYPQSNGQVQIAPQNLKRFYRILYALPVHIGQYQEIITHLRGAFSTKVKVDLKVHPLYRVEELKKKFSVPRNFTFVSSVSAPLANHYDIVLFNDNSFGVEALIQGVKCFELRLGKYALDQRLIDFDVWDATLDIQQLKSFAEKFGSESFDKSFNVALVRRYINHHYKMVSRSMIDRLYFHICGDADR